jgi:hypothetical protein
MQNVKFQRPNEALYRPEFYHIWKPLLCGAFWLPCEVMSLLTEQARKRVIFVWVMTAENLIQQHNVAP